MFFQTYCIKPHYFIYFAFKFTGRRMSDNKCRYRMIQFARGFIITLVGLIIILNSCSEDPQILSKNIFDPSTQGTLKDTVLYAIQDTTYRVKSIVDTRFSSRLFVGEYQGVQARPIMRFVDLPQNAEILSGKIRFITDGVLGAENQPAFTVTAHPVLNYWLSNQDSVWDNPEDNFDPNLILGEMDITPVANDTLYLNLNTEGLNRFTFWADTSNQDENYGMILNFSQATFLKYLGSINSSIYPQLVYTYRLPGDTTVAEDSLAVTFDAFIYSGNINMQGGLNYASTLFAHATLLKFDLQDLIDSYPDGIVINSANLEIPVDRSNSLFDPIFGAELQILALTSSLDNPTVKIDSTQNVVIQLSQWSEDSSYLEVRAGEDRQYLARGIIQKQVSNTDSLQGILIQFRDLTKFYSYIAFTKRKEPQAALRPRLKLTFWIPPTTRF